MDDVIDEHEVGVVQRILVHLFGMEDLKNSLFTWAVPKHWPLLIGFVIDDQDLGRLAHADALSLLPGN
jgi:hypothetical protein